MSEKIHVKKVMYNKLIFLNFWGFFENKKTKQKLHLFFKK